MKVKTFVKEFKEKKIQNTKVKENAISEYITKTLEIKTYIPFRTKRMIVEEIVAKNTYIVDGIKKNDSINQYISFVSAMLVAHTNLEFSQDVVADYDILAESNLLPLIITEFQQSYDECDVLLKMALASELEDNNINVLIGKFLNSILSKLDSVGEVLKKKFDGFDLADAFGGNFNNEDLAKLKGVLNKFN